MLLCVSPASTHTTSSWFSVFQFLSDSLLEPIWEVENSRNESFRWGAGGWGVGKSLHSPRKHTSRSSLLCYLWWAGRRGHLHARHLGELVGHEQIQRHTGEYTARLGSKGSEDRWHCGRISETGLLTRRMRLNATDTNLK